MAINLSIPLNDQQEEGLKFAARVFNKDRKTEHDQVQETKPEAERTAYVDLTPRQYANQLMASSCESFFVQRQADEVTRLQRRIAKLTPEQQAALNLPPEEEGV